MNRMLVMSRLGRLRLAFLQFVPLDVEDMPDHQAHVSIAVPLVSSLLDRTCAAMARYECPLWPNLHRQTRQRHHVTTPEDSFYSGRARCLHQASAGRGGGPE